MCGSKSVAEKAGLAGEYELMTAVVTTAKTLTIVFHGSSKPHGSKWKMWLR